MSGLVRARPRPSIHLYKKQYSNSLEIYETSTQILKDKKQIKKHSTQNL